MKETYVDGVIEQALELGSREHSSLEKAARCTIDILQSKLV